MCCTKVQHLPNTGILFRKNAMHQSLTTLLALCVLSTTSISFSAEIATQNKQGTGYRGIWYMNQPSGDEYVYKYSGGTGNLLRQA